MSHLGICSLLCVLLAVAGCSDRRDAEYEKLKAEAEAIKAQAEADRAMHELELAKVKAASNSVQSPTVNQGSDDMKRQVEKRILDLEKELTWAEQRDAENKECNEQEKARILKKVTEQRAQAKELRAKGENFNASGFELVADLAEEHANNGTFRGAKDTDAARKVRERIVEAKKELIRP
jgi:hypothetical protein